MELKEDASTSAGGGGGAVRRLPTKVRIIETQYVHTNARDFKSVVQRLTGKSESSTTATATAVAADRDTAAASTAGMENQQRPLRLTENESSTTEAAAGADGGVAQESERSPKGLPECSFMDEIMEMLRD
ncbi:uncharacterized protein LOC141848256 [Curcuma longa]|uniref:uncharacterized protein LOC141848256 n=1 Tax=Curcuma longa TaxID=136217 RepID=UPI003D9DE0FB